MLTWHAEVDDVGANPSSRRPVVVVEAAACDRSPGILSPWAAIDRRALHVAAVDVGLRRVSERGGVNHLHLRGRWQAA